jgi:hypothetical protein
MKTSPVYLSLACLAAGNLASHAVTVSVNSHLASTNVAGTLLAVSSGSSVQNLPNNGNINAATSALAQNNLGGGSWEFVGNSTPATLSATRGNSGSNSAIAGTGNLAYQIRFDLGIGESANLAFDFNYSLIEAGFNGVIAWNLTGPNGAIAAISGNVGDAASTSQNLANQSIATQLASISSPGTYTFDLTASVPAVNPKSSSINLAFNSIDFSIQSVPETGPMALGAIGLLVLLQRNRNIRA